MRALKNHNPDMAKLVHIKDRNMAKWPTDGTIHRPAILKFSGADGGT